MSLYQECSRAAEKLMETPPREHGGVFTEIDVVRVAADKNWSNDDFNDALLHANQVLGTMYRARKLVRFGPVKLPEDREDYARIATKIVYAASGVESWETVNGTFLPLPIEHDSIKRQGRKKFTNRTDIEPWTDQGVAAVCGKPPRAKGRKKTTATERALLKEVAELRARVEELEDRECVPA